ncbi:hypothetical protein BJ165DRAFT_1562362 [Panaeolus papilionaceus]|nr:hypothetical protein BJ165DRAFT_1562362 [Panaeolus papilionaceus]
MDVQYNASTHGRGGLSMQVSSADVRHTHTSCPKRRRHPLRVHFLALLHQPHQLDPLILKISIHRLAPRTLKPPHPPRRYCHSPRIRRRSGREQELVC